MKSVYLSSTFSDLKDHRRAVVDLLSNCGYTVDAMEKHPARDDRPREACEKDVAQSDIYVGLFAWRYGSVPQPNNAENKSITELEYIAAGRAGKPRLLFLLADDEPWPDAMKDAPNGVPAGAAILALRARLAGDHWAAFFRSPADLANKVITSIFQLEATQRVEAMAAADWLQRTDNLGVSYLGNIQNQVQHLAGAKFVEMRLGPTPWWNTRLHLVAALASDFTEISQLVLLDEPGHLLAIAPPTEVRRAFTKSEPRLERAYLEASGHGNQRAGSAIEHTVFSYSEAVCRVFGRPIEKDAVEVLTPRRIAELGIRSQGEVMEIEGAPLASIRSDLLRRAQPYVVLTRHGQIEGIVDKLELSSRIARLALQ
jgi:Domain of unknown function (DUF4062)